MAWPKGRPRSAETRAKIGAAKRGRTLSAETRAKMSAAMGALWIAREQAAMEGLDDAAVLAFARARDGGESIASARALALRDMAERRRAAA